MDFSMATTNIISAMSRRRRSTSSRSIASGQSLHEIARRKGVTRGRVFQIIQRNRGVDRVPGVPMS
jgi:hypothetical protein